MLLKGLLFIIVLLIAGFAVIAVFASLLVAGVIRRFRRAVGGAGTGRSDRRSRDYTGRRQQQYAYREAAGQQRAGTGRRRQCRPSQTDEKIVIFDARSEYVANRRIFADDEGEYVEFTEVTES